MEVRKHLSKIPEAHKIALRKATSTNGIKKAVLRSIQNQSLSEALQRSKPKAMPISKENIAKLAPKVIAKVKSITRTIAVTKKSAQKDEDQHVSDQSAKRTCLGANVRNTKPVNILRIPDGVLDIDKGACNPFQCNEYASNIFRHLRLQESQYTIRRNFLSGQRETNSDMRSDLIDWIHRNASRLELYEETFYLAVALIDLYLQHVDTPPSCLPLLGVTALLISCKYEEIRTPSINELVKILLYRHSRTDILNMECSVLKVLEFKVGRPAPIQFLRRYTQANKCGILAHNLSKFFLELSLLNYNLASVNPSLLAAAASSLSSWVLADMPWTREMEFYSGYSVSDVCPVTKELAKFVEMSETMRNQAVRRKFSGERYLQVALLPQLVAIVKCFP